MSVLTLLAAGPGISLQDGGRTGWRRYGISTAGAMDRLHLAMANRLLGNPAQMAALEVVLGGCRLRVEEGPVHLAASGPGLDLTVDDRPVPRGQSVEVAEGQIVTLGAVRDGVYGYLAVAGGFDFPDIMGSMSSHRRSNIAVAEIVAGVRLPARPARGARGPARGAQGPARGAQGAGPNRLRLVPQHATGPIRVIPGPQDDWFDAGAMARLTQSAWRIGARSDRMGIYLDGPSLHAQGGSMVSDGVVPGSIQVPPSGAPILLMRDCQTTGGYPKIATVISADLDRLAQMAPGQTLRFTPVSQAEAMAALRAARTLEDGLRTEPAIRLPDTASLSTHNLIDGVWG